MTIFSIINIERSSPDNIVTSLHWTARLKEGRYTAFTAGVIELPTKNPDDSTFIKYEDLTQDQAIQWLKEVMGAKKVSDLEFELVAQIETQKNPTSATGTPWNDQRVVIFPEVLS